jgi:hypothetical protein
VSAAIFEDIGTMFLAGPDNLAVSQPGISPVMFIDTPVTHKNMWLASRQDIDKIPLTVPDSAKIQTGSFRLNGGESLHVVIKITIWIIS